jgi:nitroreductase
MKHLFSSVKYLSMDVIDAVRARRSIRLYSRKLVSAKLVNEILEAGRLAPSGCNVQPTRYFIIRSAKTKQRIMAKRVFLQDWVYTAPIILVFCGDPSSYKSLDGMKYQIDDRTLPSKLTEMLPYLSDTPNRLIRDISISSAFSVLRAQELGLGTCYIGLVRKKLLKSMLKIPKAYIIPFAMAIGYPAENPQQRPRKELIYLKLGTV